MKLSPESSSVIYKFNIKRVFRTTKARKLALYSSAIISLLFFIFFIKIPMDRAIKAKEVSKLITQVLGRKSSYEWILPVKNTTLFQPPVVCKNEVFSIILVKSAPQNIDRRNILRQAWFQFLPTLEAKVEVYFFIGLPSDGNIALITEEASQFQDIILEDIEENFYLLTVKTLRMIKWFINNKCTETVKYFIKTDDDMFLHVPNIISEINSVPQAWVNYIGGQLHLDESVVTDPESKWFSSIDLWPEKYYPPFVSGALTVISSEVVPNLLKASLNVELFHLEDIFLTGIVGFQKLNIVPSNIKGIEISSPMWLVRLKMALGFQNLPKTYVAFHAPESLDFIEELYRQVTT